MFMQDIEEDPEMRQNIDLFRVSVYQVILTFIVVQDDDVIAELEAEMAKMDLEKKPKSEDKLPVAGGRNIVKVERKSKEGKEHQ